ncbi:MAG: hypothetical protein KGL95_02675, partial [Patescibacteria group bacterium]|nr:hypothetical protein [Patescibacteria group bacterium]
GATSGYVGIQAPSTPTTYTLQLPSDITGATNQVLQIIGISGNTATLGWTTVATGINPWDVADGAIHAKSSTYDLLLGGLSTASAKFAVINVNSGTPTASISANNGNNSTYLSGNGTLGTTNFQNLTLGGSTTGNISISPLNGNGTLTLNGNFVQTGSSTFTTGTGLTTVSGNLLANGTASISGAITLFGTPTIQSTSFQNLTLGGTTTGSIFLNGLNGSGNGINFTGYGTGVIISSASGNLISSKIDLSSSSYVANVLGIGNGGTGTSSTPSQGTLLIGNASNGYSVATLTPGSGISITNGSGSITIADTQTSWFTQNLGLLYPINSTLDFALGGTATTSSKFAVINVGSGTPVASISANNGNNSTYISGNGILATTNKQNLTLGDTTTTGQILLSNLTLANAGLNIPSGQNLTLSGITSANQVLFANGSGNVTGVTTTSTPNLCLLSGTTTPAWGTCALGTNYFQLNGNVISPYNTTLDLAVGGNSTSSALF